MMYTHGLILAFASTVFGSLTSALPIHDTPTYELQLVHQFPNLTWIENMAIRSNGQILATDISAGQVFLVDPYNTTQTNPTVIVQLAKGTTIAGIVEVEDDVFYTMGSLNSNIYNFTFTPNTTTVWQIDMRGYASTGQAVVSKVVELPKVEVANGLTLLSKEAGTILIADSAAGLIWTLNVHTGVYFVAVDDPLLKPATTARPSFGVNGIKVNGSDLFFSNLNQGLLAKYPAADDFAIGADGSVWLCENVLNTLVRVSPNGTVTTIAGGANSTTLGGPVAAKFGRGRFDRDVLYVSTNGLLFDAKGNVLSTNGKIAALDTSTFGV